MQDASFIVSFVEIVDTPLGQSRSTVPVRSAWRLMPG
jgi:hypothetical protein